MESYGTGTQVRLPGKSAMEPRIFKFGTPYAEMYASLAATPEDRAFFVHNGVLHLCKRGAAVKVSVLRGGGGSTGKAGKGEATLSPRHKPDSIDEPRAPLTWKSFLQLHFLPVESWRRRGGRTRPRRPCRSTTW